MTDVKYVPIRSLARSACQSAVDFVFGQPIHKGRFGDHADIYQGCLNTTNCPYVVKVRTLYTQEKLNDFLQEQFFAQYVNEEFHARKQSTTKLTNITPRIHDVWTCHEKMFLRGYILMDRMDGTLMQYIHQNASTLTNDDLSNLALRLVQLFHVLISLSIWHPNITLHHLVYRRTEMGAMELFIIDWNKVVWDKTNNQKLINQYDHLLRTLLLRIEREQARAMKLPKIFHVPIATQSFSQPPKPSPLTTESFQFSSSVTPPLSIPHDIKETSLPLPVSHETELESEPEEQPEPEHESPYEYLPPVSPPPEGFDQDAL